MEKRHLPNANIIALICLAALLIGLVAPGVARAGAPADRISESVRVLREMSEQSDVEAMARLLKNAKGIAVFPSVLKAGIMIGGRYGQGLVLRRDPEKGEWYGPDFVEIKGVSYGPQFGFQSTALVLVIANEKGMEGFTGDKVTLGGDLAVAVGPLGRQAGAATDVDLKASIYSYSMSKGIFAGASLEGAVIRPDKPANELYWKSALRPDEILARKTTDPRVQPLIKEIDHILLKLSGGADLKL
ncbi:MAG: lipid-binding SYLF domain-containing protein [Firmicutes bacterium]|nr:lipid-binding SYLF domain-containing protein [Bacillota bacterium]